MSNRDELLWLGQAGFVLKSGGVSVMIDPFLSEHEKRLYPPPKSDIVLDVDWVLITHEHLDHLDTAYLAVLAERRPDLRVILPSPISEQVAGIIPTQHVTGVEPGEILKLGGVQVEVVPAFHGMRVEDGFSDGSENGGPARFVGYILRTPYRIFYHSGDTVVTRELIDSLMNKEIEIAFLPINGRDFFREDMGIVGNLTFREAVQLGSRIGASVLVPMHWDLFDGNTERPAAAVEEAMATTSLHVLVLARFVPYRW